MSTFRVRMDSSELGGFKLQRMETMSSVYEYRVMEWREQNKPDRKTNRLVDRHRHTNKYIHTKKYFYRNRMVDVRNMLIEESVNADSIMKSSKL